MHIVGVNCILTAPAGIGLAVVKVSTSEPGIYGVGCATFTQRLGAVRTVVEQYLQPLLVGRDPHRIEDLWQLMYQNAYWRNGPVLNNALSGVDQALWDIKGKIAGLPLYELLGGRVRDGAAAYVHAEGRDPEEVLERVLALREAGLAYVRCQMGGYGGIGTAGRATGGGPAEPRRQPGQYFDPVVYAREVPQLFEFLRSRVGFKVGLLHDVHERLAPIDAIRLAKELEPFRLTFLEDPLAPEDQAWLAQLRCQTATPIALGELFTHPLEWRALIAARQIDFIRVHISAIGGITPARKLAALADAFGVRTAFHGPGDVSPVGHAANIHLDLALPNFGIQEFTPLGGALEEVFPGAPTMRDGYLHPGDGAGLGIDIDEELAGRYPIHADMAQFSQRVVEWTQTRLPDGTLWRP
jgi:mannonate dehydratase